MKNSWSINAYTRHRQVVDGLDISFSEVLVPTILRTIKHLPTYDQSIALDVGCGTGFLTRVISQHLKQVDAIDSSSGSLDIARSYNSDRNNVFFYEGRLEDIRTLPINSSYDIIVSNMVFHTVENIKTAIGSVRTIIRNRGRLIVSLPHPNFWHIIREHDFDSNFTYDQESYHELPFYISNDPNPLPAQTPYYHRPLSTWIKLFVSHRLSIIDVREPIPSPDTMQKYPQKWKYPRFIIFELEATS